jgi:four helix bundle protein
MKDFRDLRVWRKAHELTLLAYRCTATFPREELYGLTSQIRRCAASVAANIAEGCGKRGNAEFQRFLNISTGSASELEYHFLLSRDLHLLLSSRLREAERRGCRGQVHVGRSSTQSRTGSTSELNAEC